MVKEEGFDLPGTREPQDGPGGWLPPPVTASFVVVSAVIFVLQCIDAYRIGEQPLSGMPTSTLMRFGAMSDRTGPFEAYRLVTACFGHMFLAHMVLNMWGLVELGGPSERLLGRVKYAALFLGAGAVGFIASHAWFAWIRNSAYVSAGASGAVCGLAGFVAAADFVMGGTWWKKLAVFLVVGGALLSLLQPINHAAHVGGLAFGAIFGFFVVPKKGGAAEAGQGP